MNQQEFNKLLDIFNTTKKDVLLVIEIIQYGDVLVDIEYNENYKNAFGLIGYLGLTKILKYYNSNFIFEEICEEVGYND